MKPRQFPFFTMTLLAILIALHFIPVDKTLLYFSATDIAQGETWRVLSGHFIHADLQHLFWNCLGLLVLGTLIERRSGWILCTTLGTGVIAVSLLLLSPVSKLDYYCGLSGVLNTLLLVALWLEWMHTRSRTLLVVACLCLAKVVFEVSLGTSVITHISWPPYAWSHVAGLAGGVVLILFHMGFGSTPAPVVPRHRQINKQTSTWV